MRRLDRRVFILGLLAEGCSAARPHPAARNAMAPGAAPAADRVALAQGTLLVERRRAGLVVAAPHGTSDRMTDLIGQEVARRADQSALVATGFVSRHRGGWRFTVNRPTESTPGTAADQETRTADAVAVWDAYRGALLTAAQGPVRLYTEIHGNTRESGARQVEVATVGVSESEARRLKAPFEAIRDTAVKGDAPAFAVLVEPMDHVHYRAAASKRSGSLSMVPRALHIELPRAARLAHREAYVPVLADFVAQAADLLAARVA
jgi:hypothetical protein